MMEAVVVYVGWMAMIGGGMCFAGLLFIMGLELIWRGARRYYAVSCFVEAIQEWHKNHPDKSTKLEEVARREGY